jgi:hypothetical protein
LTKSAFGSPIRSGLDPRFEKTQNLVSTKVPEVIESLRASCNGNGIVMVKAATSTMCELYEALEVIHVVWARLVVFGVYSTSRLVAPERYRYASKPKSLGQSTSRKGEIVALYIVPEL